LKAQRASECYRQVAPAIDAALLKVNSRLADGSPDRLASPDFSLTVNYADSMCDSAESLNHAIDFYMAGHVRNFSLLFDAFCPRDAVLAR